MRGRVLGALLVAGLGVGDACAQKPATCVSAMIEGDVTAGASFAKEFAPGLVFLLEPMASGWMVRVVAAQRPRTEHDFAELATPPYRSVTPLAVSTDFSFRAQDAVAWNPRRFRYAADAATFADMSRLYEARSKPEAGGKLAALAAAQPEAVLTIVDAKIAPGRNDQAQTAATVASHFATTPHTVDTAATSALGRIEELRFRAELSLRPGVRPAKGVASRITACGLAGIFAR